MPFLRCLLQPLMNSERALEVRSKRAENGELTIGEVAIVQRSQNTQERGEVVGQKEADAAGGRTAHRYEKVVEILGSAKLVPRDELAAVDYISTTGATEQPLLKWVQLPEMSFILLLPLMGNTNCTGRGGVAAAQILPVEGAYLGTDHPAGLAEYGFPSVLVERCGVDLIN